MAAPQNRQACDARCTGGEGARRRVIFPCVLTLLAAMAVLHSQSSGSTGTIASNDTPVLLLPDPSRVPLTLLAAGRSVKILGAEDEWLNIEFLDNMFGRRVGYVLKGQVKIEGSTIAAERAQKLAEAQAAARRSVEAASSTANQGPARCRRVDCIPIRDLIASPPRLVNQQISATLDD